MSEAVARRSAAKALPIWWGDFHLAAGRTGRWRVGPLELWVHHGEREWRVLRRGEPAGDPGSTEQSVDLDVDLPPEQEPLEIARYAFRATDGKLRVAPLLADRPVVASPRMPLYVLPDEEAVLFVSSPVWLRFDVEEPPKLLQEVPSHRLSDTWFGTTREGELGYALPTSARLRVSELQRYPNLAVTAVRVRNQGIDALHLEKLKLPVPFLSLFDTADGGLWTEEALLVRGVGAGLASLDIEPGPPPQVTGATLLAAPRQVVEKGRIIRAFSSWLDLV